MNNLIDIRHHKFNKDDLNEFKKHKDFEGDIDGVYKVMRVIFYNNNEPIVLDLKQAHHNRRVRNFDLNGLFLSFYEMKECLKAK